jgi:hypothetical protein
LRITRVLLAENKTQNTSLRIKKKEKEKKQKAQH